MQLYNTLSAKERAALLEQAGDARLTLSFYNMPISVIQNFLETIYF